MFHIIMASILMIGLLTTIVLSPKCSKSFTMMAFTGFLIILESIWWNWSDVAIGWKILSILVAILSEALVILRIKKMIYDFTGKFMSISKWVNFLKVPAGGDRVVGRIIPYNRSQIRYNGQCIASDSIATAGMTLISGSVGSGKTREMVSWMKQNIQNGDPVIFMEYKGDTDLVKELKSHALAHQYEVYTLSQEKADFNYDPLKNINNTGRVECIMNMRKWSLDGADAHYKMSVQLLLQRLVNSFVMPDNAENYTMEFYQYIKKYHWEADFREAYFTISKLLELLITSQLHDMFTFKHNKTLDFGGMKQRKWMVIASFASSNKDLATSFSSLMLKDLLDECTMHVPNGNIFLYMDEFGTLENSFIVKDVIEKGRSAKIAVTLALQDINQIIIKTNEAYLNSLLGTLNNFIIFSGATRNTAEKFAGVQLQEIEAVLMNLKKPIRGKKPTAIYISKYGMINKHTNTEVFKFEPTTCKPEIGNGVPLEKRNLPHVENCYEAPIQNLEEPMQCKDSLKKEQSSQEIHLEDLI